VSRIEHEGSHTTHLLPEAEPGGGAADAVHLDKPLHQRPLEDDGQHHVGHVEHDRRNRRLFDRNDPKWNDTKRHKQAAEPTAAKTGGNDTDENGKGESLRA